MRGDHRRGPYFALWLLLTFCPCALALNPALDVSQYAHTSWKIRDGFTKGFIGSITQTPDGYLWLGTEFGLMRFDGVRNVPWQPPANEHLPSNNISRLLTTRDGTLWIGTLKGLASWKGGKLTQYPELAGQEILALREDHEGTVWAGGIAFPPPGRLCTIRNGSVQCFGDDGRLGNGVVGLYEDSRGNLWAGVRDGLWRWRPGPPKFFPLPIQPDGIQGLAEADDGTLLVSIRRGILRFVDGRTEEAYPFPDPTRQVQATSLLRDRDGGLWIGTPTGGLAHVHQGTTDAFEQTDGLSGDDVSALYEDREGSIWVATIDGLDRFRDYAVATFSANQGLSNSFVSGVLAADDGSIWLRTSDGLRRWNRGRVTAYRERAQRGPDAPANVREIAGSGLPDHYLSSIFQDARGRIWIATLGGVGFLDNERFILAKGVPGGTVHAFAEDTEGNLWIANQNLGLFRLSPRNEVQQIPGTKLGHKDFVSALAADSSRGGLWLGFYQGGIIYFAGGEVRESYSNGITEGRVTDLRVDGDGPLWASTEGGLSRLKNGRIATLTSKNGLPCDVVHWTMEDDNRSLWLNTACGLVRIARSELDAWSTDPSHPVKFAVFDSSDGIRSASSAGGYAPLVGKSPDGKLWFGSADGLSVVDPKHLPFNKLPPPVRIEQVKADGKVYDLSNGTHLPALVRDVWIDYTALSLVAPETTRFRYMLEGQDRDWKEVTNDREAQYSNLPPRRYRFRVMAANNSGVWNEAGASLDFSIAPAFYQTGWFLALCVAAFLSILTALYQARLRHLGRQFEIRMEERLNERMRLARDLHDTLLQSFQGVLLKFSAVEYLLPDRTAQARTILSTAIEQARAAIKEGRDTIQELRTSTVITNDLAHAIGTFGEHLCAAPAGERLPEFRLHVEGQSRDLPPIIRDEVYRIACEALRNAFRHAQARRIVVEIGYERWQLRLRVRDDGKGIDRKVLDAGSREGHHGLTGIHERARLVAGKLAVWSELDAGTQIELTIPAVVAYTKSAMAVAKRSIR